MDSVRKLQPITTVLTEEELLNEDNSNEVTGSQGLTVESLKVAALSLNSPTMQVESVVPPLNKMPVAAEEAAMEVVAEPTIVPPPTITVPKQVEASGSNPVDQQARPNREKPRCPICRKNHLLRFCRKFEKMDLELRFRKVALHKVCYRCLLSGHVSKNCKSSAKCKFCKEAHHFLLHPKTKSTKTNERQAASFADVQLRQAVAFSPTIQLNLCLPRNKVLVRSVLDLCCQNSYICADLVAKLRIPKIKINDQEHCRIEVESRFENTQRIIVLARVYQMDRVKTPPLTVSDLILEPFKGLQLTDPTFNHSGQVALVLGPEIAPMILRDRIHQSPGLPLAQYSIFGWIITGLSPY
ncbi:uncharacterized protein LOC119616050 [Lucilia sericata]|uniref:uncharacterized protein LOC119616050 n=1 Tax=Lucilia sericata TaxID=13632 RepID=UPI0018A85290|nr:uncharacterized protein LOC119616050 [Lucilia sericata]